jgi:hypothetical protein
MIFIFGREASGVHGFEEFHKFEQIYEPSGIQQLPDGRFVVVEDEASHPLDIFTFDADGRVSETPITRGSLFSWRSMNRAMNALEDLEAITLDGQGRVYAITSHSRKADGKRDDHREQLVRFSLNAEEITNLKVLRGLRKKIIQQHKALKDAAKIQDVKEDEGFNIEGLGFDAKKQRLLIGLRGPLERDKAIIVVLENPQAVFDLDEEPRISDQLITLDLDGGGIRSLCYDPNLQGYLVISRKLDKSFKLWIWNGNTNDSPRRIKVPGIKDLRQAEGVTPVSINGQAEGILIVSDEGDIRKKKPGRYLFLRYDQLEIQ